MEELWFLNDLLVPSIREHTQGIFNYLNYVSGLLMH